MCKLLRMLLLCSSLAVSCCSNRLFSLQIEEAASVEECCAGLIRDIVWDNVFPISVPYGFYPEAHFPDCGHFFADVNNSIRFSLVTQPFNLVVFAPLGFDVNPACLAHLVQCKKVYVMRCALRDAIMKSAEVAEQLQRLRVISMAGCLGETVNQVFYWERPSLAVYSRTSPGYNADS